MPVPTTIPTTSNTPTSTSPRIGLPRSKALVLNEAFPIDVIAVAARISRTW
jgi:hypothetical protein